jgi:hypothetical protein
MTKEFWTLDKEGKLFLKTSGSTYITAACHVPENHTAWLHRSENLKTDVSI